MVMDNSGGSGSSLNAQFTLALSMALVLPLAGLLGTAAAVWFLNGDQIGTLEPRWEIFFLSVVGGALLITLLIAALLTRMRGQIRTQVTQLVNTCRAVIEGVGQARAPVNGTDEMAVLATQLNTVLDMRDNSATNANDTALQSQIEKLLQEVSAVGEGDLTIQAEVTPDTLGVLADSFNYMIEELAKVVGHVQSTTQQVIQQTRRIIERSGELARNSEAQTAQIGQTSEQVEDLAAFILSAARDATLSANAAQEAAGRATEGKQAVIDTITGMGRIRKNVQDTAKKIKRLGERSQEISDIVRIIEDLSEQTNLLALNAAIQAAMGSDNGRGFAVVADEIRLLAEKSSEAAKRIVGLVKSIQTETQEAVVAMEESTSEVVAGSARADIAGNALEDILLAVDLQVHMVEDIAQAANERTQTSESVAMAMNRISDITQQTNATLNDTAMSVSFLAELADQLRASVSTFRLPSHMVQPGGPHTVVRPMSYPQQPAPALAPRQDGFGAPYNTSGMPALPPGQGTGQFGGYAMGQNTAHHPRSPVSRPVPGYEPQPQTGPSGPFPGYGQQQQTGQFPSGPFGPPQPEPGQRMPDRRGDTFDPWEDEQQFSDGRGTWDGH